MKPKVVLSEKMKAKYGYINPLTRKIQQNIPSSGLANVKLLIICSLGFR